MSIRASRSNNMMILNNANNNNNNNKNTHSLVADRSELIEGLAGLGEDVAELRLGVCEHGEDGAHLLQVVSNVCKGVNERKKSVSESSTKPNKNQQQQEKK